MLNDGYAKIILAVGRTGPAGISLLGTAFSIGGNRFVTAAHLTQQNDDGLILCLPWIEGINQYQDTTINQVNFRPARITTFDPIADIAILEVNDLAVATDVVLSGTDDVPPGANVSSLGFPHCGDGRMVLTYQQTVVGARVLLAAGPLKRKHLVLNVLTRPGQSGSPIFVGNSNRICAMLLGGYIPARQGSVLIGGIDPAALHQTTHAVSAEYIREML